MKFLLTTKLIPNVTGILIRKDNVIEMGMCKRFKVTLISSSYSLTSGRCINKRPHLLAQHA